MTPEIISDILALLERTQLSGKEVPAFNRVVGSLLAMREEALKEIEKKQTNK